MSSMYMLEPRTPLAEGARAFTSTGEPSSFRGGSPSGSLTRELFHRNHPEEPLRPTANRSLPAAHLSPSLCATVVGLAWNRPGAEGVHAALREATCSETGLTLPKLARETGVSIARFERLVEHVEAADDEMDAPIASMGTALVLRHLWLRASTRSELWTYLRTLHALTGGLLAGDDEAAAASWTSMPIFTASEVGDEAALQAVRTLLSPSTMAGGLTSCTDSSGRLSNACADRADATAVADAFEVVAAAVALGGSRPAPLEQGRYSFEGQSPVADCSELVARTLLNHWLWEPAIQRYDDDRLPHSAMPRLRAFYAPGGPAEARVAPSPQAHPEMHAATPSDVERFDAAGAGGHAGGNWHAGAPSYSAAAAAWFELCSGLPTVAYLSGLPARRYELAPTVDAVSHCLGVLLGHPTVRTPEDLEALWLTLQPDRTPRLRTNARRDRLFVLEPSSTPTGAPCSSVPRATTTGWRARSHLEEGLECVLELVMAERLNHAFAIHHWRPPQWQREAAELALLAIRRAGDHMEHDRVLPLLPALLQPLIRQGAAAGGGGDGDSGRFTTAAATNRLMLRSADPHDAPAVCAALQRVIRDADDALTAQTAEMIEEGRRSARLAVGVLAATCGLPAAQDAMLLQLASVAARSASPEIRSVALLHAPLNVPVAVLAAATSGPCVQYGRQRLLQIWLGAVASEMRLSWSPLRCLRLTAEAALQLTRMR